MQKLLVSQVQIISNIKEALEEEEAIEVAKEEETVAEVAITEEEEAEAISMTISMKAKNKVITIIKKNNIINQKEVILELQEALEEATEEKVATSKTTEVVINNMTIEKPL